MAKDAADSGDDAFGGGNSGVNNQVGSIEKAIANLVVMRGDIFGKEKTITHVFVDGKLFEQKEKPKTPPNATTQPGAVANIDGDYFGNTRDSRSTDARDNEFNPAGNDFDRKFCKLNSELRRSKTERLPPKVSVITRRLIFKDNPSRFSSKAQLPEIR